MSYREALEATGATVHAFDEFGSYQGDWWAKVTHEGSTFWVNGSFGSCSGCDAFEAEFGYNSYEECEDHYNAKDNCTACTLAKAAYKAKLAEFGKGYLVSGHMTQDEALDSAKRNSDWDGEATKMVEFITANAITQ